MPSQIAQDILPWSKQYNCTLDFAVRLRCNVAGCLDLDSWHKTSDFKISVFDWNSQTFQPYWKNCPIKYSNTVLYISVLRRMTLATLQLMEFRLLVEKANVWNWMDFMYLLCIIHEKCSQPPSVHPEGRLGMSDVHLLSGISGLSFDSPFLSPLLLFFCLVLLLFLSCHFSANGPFSWLFFLKKTLK